MLDRILLTARLLPALPKLVGYKPGSKSTVADLFERQAERRGSQPLVLYEDRTVSWGELDAHADRVAHWGNAAGLRTGDVAALLMENRPEYLATWLGLAKLGVTTALINTNLSGRGLRHALATSGTSHLVVGSECLDRFATTADDLERPLQVLVDDDVEDGDTGPRPSDALRFADVLAEQPEGRSDPARRADLIAGDDLFYIYTSGTTGLPKAAHFSHMRFLGIGDLCRFALDLNPEDVNYCALPLYHSAGGVMLVSSVLHAGATIAMRRRFSASRFWDDVRRYRATHFQYIGEFCRYLMNQPPRPDDRDHQVRAIIGNGLRPDIWAGFQERFGIRDIREFYGATEGNTALMNFENKVGSVGRYPFKAMTNARLIRYDVDEDSHPRDARGFCIECEEGEVGELVGRIPANADSPTGRFEGYTSKEATDKKILRDVFQRGDAYFRTGDLLRQDRDGFFYFVDRIGDTFRWKGENVSTQEVAEAISGLPGLEMVNVYGVEVPGADGRAGMAALLFSEGAGFDGTAFFQHVQQSLPRYASPIFVRVLQEQEVTGTFKIRKVELVREGFDPSLVSDPLYVRDEKAGAYVPLTPEVFAEIASGARSV
ncbi:MAG: long-chain-acyl-CoA synthetase [Myxococcota bacterium]